MQKICNRNIWQLTNKVVYLSHFSIKSINSSASPPLYKQHIVHS